LEEKEVQNKYKKSSEYGDYTAKQRKPRSVRDRIRMVVGK
jgi:hypothetical protein